MKQHEFGSLEDVQLQLRRVQLAEFVDAITFAKYLGKLESALIELDATRKEHLRLLDSDTKDNE